MRGSFSILLLVILLISLLFCEIEPRQVQAQGIVYIRSDGTIDPPSTPIVTVDNVTYTLIANVSSPIVVERSHITLDGVGYTVQGDGSVGSVGIRLDSRWNVTVKNITITGWWYGIDAAMAYSCVITQNLLTSNMLGIRMYYFSSNNTFAENRIVSNNNTGIKLSMDSKQNVITRNRISENPFGIAMNTATQNTVIQNLVARNDYGIWLQDSNLNTICHNDFVCNSFQTYCINSNNTWDEDYPSGGNYWSDYSGSDANGDGIGDTPYVINTDNRDNYPVMNPFLLDEHDIGITSLNTSKSICGQGYTVHISLVVFNYGEYTEAFNLTCHANETVLMQRVSLELIDRTPLTADFAWNTTGMAYGNYSISAFASPVEGETCLTDNTLVDGWVFVSIPGDINGDQYVNAKDAVILGGALGFKPGDLNWEPNADINDDGYVNAKDAVILGTYFSQHWP